MKIPEIKEKIVNLMKKQESLKNLNKKKREKSKLKVWGKKEVEMY
ncbi:hypothetical protein X975_01588, partial [Stegodyphus mimosarum]